MTNEPAMTPSKDNNLLSFLLLLAAAFAVYGRILGHDFLLNWDDNWYVLFPEEIRGISWKNLRTIFTSYYVGNYAPVQMLSYMLDHSLWGLSAEGFLFTNIIIHTTNSFLAYRLFLRLHQRRFSAGFAAALFLLHPVQVETVAWVSQRKNLLAMLFFLLAWEFYCRYRDAGQRKERLLLFNMSATTFVAALLAKSVAVILPAVLVLYDSCFPDKDRLRLKDKIPYLLAATIVASITVHAQGASGGGRTGFHGGSPLATLFTMLPVFCRYVVMLVWPVNLSADYAPTIHHTLNLAVIGAFLALTVIGLATVRLFKADRQLGFWAIYFWIALLPVSQVVPLLTLMNDRYLYFPMLGVAALGGAGAQAFRVFAGMERRTLQYLLFVLPMLMLSALSIQKAGAWRNDMTLWSDAVKNSPNSAKAWAFLGAAHQLAGDGEQARHAYQRGLALNPSSTYILNGLGELYTEEGELDKGLELLERAVASDPENQLAWGRLGYNYLKRRDYPKAEHAFTKALTLQRDAKQVILWLGETEILQGHLEQARNHYLQVEEKGWNDPDVAYQLACVESLAGHTGEALAWLAKALQRGYDDYDKLHGDNSLSTLRQSPRFNQLMQQYPQK